MQLRTEPLYLHLFIYFPFHRVSWFAASFIFRRSALFFHLCHYFSVTLLWIFAVGGEAAAVYSRETAGVLQLLRGPCDARDAAQGLRYTYKSTILCFVSLSHSVRAPVVSRRCESKERLTEGEKKNETGGGASAETYDALMIRGGLFLLAFP